MKKRRKDKSQRTREGYGPRHKKSKYGQETEEDKYRQGSKRCRSFLHQQSGKTKLKVEWPIVRGGTDTRPRAIYKKVKIAPAGSLVRSGMTRANVN